MRFGFHAVKIMTTNSTHHTNTRTVQNEYTVPSWNVQKGTPRKCKKEHNCNYLWYIPTTEEEGIRHIHNTIAYYGIQRITVDSWNNQNEFPRKCKRNRTAIIYGTYHPWSKLEFDTSIPPLLIMEYQRIASLTPLTNPVGTWIFYYGTIKKKQWHHAKQHTVITCTYTGNTPNSNRTIKKEQTTVSQPSSQSLMNASSVCDAKTTNIWRQYTTNSTEWTNDKVKLA